MLDQSALALSADQVRRECSVDHFEFETTAEVDPLVTIIGQPRGIRAIEFGIDIKIPGFNVFALGPTGTGRKTAIRSFLERRAQSGPTPPDWVYVHNFVVEHQPRAIEFEAGRGSLFCTDLDELVTSLKSDIPSILEGPEFIDAMDALDDEFNARREKIFEAVSEEAQKHNFGIAQTPAGLAIMLLDANKQVVPPEKIQQLDETVRQELEEQHRLLQERLADAMREVRALERAQRNEQTRLRREVVANVVDHYVNELKGHYDDHEEVLLYLGQVREDVLDNLALFAPEPEAEGGAALQQTRRDNARLRRYSGNLIVDHSRTEGAPVIVEDLPSYANLVGRVEGEVQMGALLTDFSMIKPGALHRANGGYLVLRVADLLPQPGAWDGLKRALTNHEIRIQESMIYSGVGILTPRTIDPEPIPLDLKVILLGSPAQYYLLYQVEEDFAELFKTKADFAATMPRDHDTEFEYAAFVAARCAEHDLPHFHRDAVGRLVEFGSRLAGHQDKLSTLFGQITDLIHEAVYWAQEDGQDVVGSQHVEKAIEERRYRSNLYEERSLEDIHEGTVFIDTAGEVIGQVNGLSIVGLGDYAFGQPSRITARVYQGQDGLINIEREAELSGPIYDKGVLILHGYLGGQYALDHPLTLSASLTFEQNYGGVEGDSASSTELYALLSALSGQPIKQSLAVTGSVNQRGQVQPIGGVSEKVEGFFQVCQARGLTSDQGVLIPRSNVPNLMLRSEVVEAIREGQFHVHAIETIDQGIELLTGVPAGEQGPDGRFPKGTIHHAVQERLEALYRRAKEDRDLA
jgi:predicted ATP-dependent protease